MIVEMTDVVKNYGKTKALDHLNLHVREGGLFAFLGPNGAGKTTAIRILNGLTAMDAGRAAIAGVDIAERASGVKKVCGLVSQHNNLDGELTVTENMDFHGRLFGMPGPLRRSRTSELLDYVDLADRASSRAKELSGGLKRRLLVARALLHQPKLLFLDEPTAGLDPAVRRRIWNLIKRVCRDGVTVFLTTHYIEEAEFLADRVGFIDNGRLVAEGAPVAMMAELGEWAVDTYGNDDAATRHFHERSEADAYFALAGRGAVLRRVNLEDVFLSLTGKRVR